MSFVLLEIMLSVATVLSATTVSAIRGVSRTRLIALLAERGREAWATRFFDLRRQYVRVALIIQQLLLLAMAWVVWEHVDNGRGLWFQTGCALLIFTPWVLIVGVGIPVGWARYAGDAYLAAVIPVLELLRLASAPLIATVHGVDEIVRRLTGAPKDAADPSEQIELAIMDAVSDGENSGAMDPTEKVMIRAVLGLDETSVGQIMTPRLDVVGVDIGATFDDARTRILSEGHSRIPVFEGSLDHVVGMLYAKDLLAARDSGGFRLRDVMRRAIFVPETKDLASLLREFQARRVHIAIVLDEYGGTSGLVTLEDIVERLVGDIADEHEAPPSTAVERLDARTALVDARVRVEDLNEALGTDIPLDEAYDTITGFVFSRLGRIPVIGESVSEGDVRIEIIEADVRSIRRLRIHLPDSVAAGEAAS